MAPPQLPLQRPPPQQQHAHDVDVEALGVSSSPQLVELLRAEVQQRRAEDEARYALLLEQMNAWRTERQLENEVLLEALEQLSSAMGEKP